MSLIENLYQLSVQFARLTTDLCKTKSDGEISAAAYRYLELLHKEKALTVTELAERQQVGSSCVTQVTNVLLRKGYVEKVKNDNDWRCKTVVLTQKGIELVDSTEKMYSEFMDKLQTALTSKELEQFNYLLLRILKEFDIHGERQKLTHIHRI